jgi:hypothetical protein
MRYFDNSDGKWFHKVAGEMMNLETGKKLYSKGVRKPIEIKKAKSYPRFQYDGITTTIIASMGVVYLPNHMDLHDTSRQLFQTLNEFSIKYCRELRTDESHLNRYTHLESGNDHFTSLKAKNNLLDTSFGKGPFDNLMRRIYVPNTSERLDKLVGSRFTWFVLNHDNLLDNIENYINPRIPIAAQLTSILYDPNKHFNYTDNYVLDDNITFRNLRICKGIISVNAFMDLTRDVMAIKTEIDDLEEVGPECKVLPKYIGAIKELQSYFKNYSKYPEFIPGFTLNEWNIKLCSKRRGRFEIIRQFGDFTIYNTNTKVVIYPIKDIYEVSYDEITISNGPDRSNTVCKKCNTPLYDDCYGLFNKDSSICEAYCPVCMHASFNETGYYASDGAMIYKTQSGKVVGRFTYPVTVNAVIDSIPGIDDTIRDILKASFQYNIIVDNSLNSPFSALYICPGDIKTAKYIAWNGPINRFISYIWYPEHKIHKLAKDKINEIMEKSKIFFYWPYSG